jgi:carboxymethylenebutenolidase
MGVTVTFPTRSGTGQGYLAVPSAVPSASSGRTGGPAPAVVVVHQWWSSDPQVRGVADRFAAEGFVALVPDLYHGVPAGRPDPATDLLMGLAMDTAADDIVAAAGYLAGRPDGTATPIGAVGTVGFGIGGSLALWSAARSEQVTAAAAWYPELPWERMPSKWDGYLDTAALVHLPERGGPDPAAVDGLGQAVLTAGGHFTAHTYARTRAAFFNDDRPEAYDGDAAALSWARTLELFRHRLAGTHRAAA